MFIASNLLVLFAIAVIILSYSYIIGYPFAKKISSNAAFELSFPLGIAILAITALWINNLLNIGIIQTILIFLLPLGLSFWLNKPTFAFYKEGLLKKSILVLPLLLSFIVASGVCIKVSGSEISLSQPLFDHIKVAVINTIIRDGFPIKNPFTIDPSAGDLFHYYYLFYLLAANIAILFHCSSLNADIILTFIAAFVSILTCFCLLGELLGNSNNRIKAQYILCLFLFSGSIVGLINFISNYKLYKILSTVHPLESWIIQAAWVPQHLLGASCSILALFFLGIKTIKDKYNFFIIVVLIGSGFGFSVWVGGVAFAVVSILLFYDQIRNIEKKKQIIIQWVGVAIASMTLILPVMYNVVCAPTRQSGFPIGFAIYNSSTYGYVVDIFFFFIGALPLWLFVITIGLYFILFQSFTKRFEINCQCKILLFICFSVIFIALVMRSQIASNDLAWRAILFFVLAGSVLLSYYFVEYFTFYNKIFFLLLTLLGFIEPIQFSQLLTYGNGYYLPKPSISELKVINQITNKDDRLLMNGHQNEKFEFWGGNIVSLIMVNRLFCYVNRNFGAAFGPNWANDVFRMDKVVRQFYDGHADENDLALIKQFQCNKIIVTRYDPIWNHIPYHNLKVIYSDNDRKILVFDQ